MMAMQCRQRFDAPCQVMPRASRTSTSQHGAMHTPAYCRTRYLLGCRSRVTRRFWQRQIGDSNEVVLVVDDPEGDVVGFGSAGRSRHANLDHDGEVYTLYLLADWRNHGLGRSLLNALFDALSERGYASAIIWVLADNPSRFFYENLGGRMAAEKVEKLWGAPVRQFAYSWASLERAIA